MNSEVDESVDLFLLNWRLISSYLNLNKPLQWNSVLASRGADDYKRRLYGNPTIHDLFAPKSNECIHLCHFLTKLAADIQTIDDLEGWIEMVELNPHGTPLISPYRPFGLYDTFIGAVHLKHFPNTPGSSSIHLSSTPLYDLDYSDLFDIQPTIPVFADSEELVLGVSETLIWRGVHSGTHLALFKR